MTSSSEGADFMAETHELLDRREAIRGSIGAALALVLSKTTTAAEGQGAVAKADERPNILFCIADDWSWPHAGVAGDPVVRTPTFDAVAREGVLFTNAFCASPSCTPSRGGILTGQAVHRLKEGGNLWSTLRTEFQVYPDLLEQAGYVVGLQGKGWAPGDFKPGGRTRNPAGPPFRSFGEFLAKVPEGKPFCFWFGSNDPHRPYEKGTGAQSGMKIEDVKLPPYWPDTPEVRSDVLDYYFEVQRFDSQVGQILKALEASGRAANTLVVMTSDNGMPFPRCKANLYDSGTHMPLAIRWPARVKGGRAVEAFVSLRDMAPTFLEAAGLAPLPEITARSLVPILMGGKADGRDKVFVERERHANVRAGDLSYPARAIRTARFLYIRNLRPDRWPAGDPETWKAVGPFGDIDGGPTKDYILEHREDPRVKRYFELACAKRPAEELYDLAKDPFQVENVAGGPEYKKAQAQLSAELDKWMKETADPRASGGGDEFDGYEYYGSGPEKKANRPAK
jgi:arylsulfatase A-like enzyme